MLRTRDVDFVMERTVAFTLIVSLLLQACIVVAIPSVVLPDVIFTHYSGAASGITAIMGNPENWLTNELNAVSAITTPVLFPNTFLYDLTFDYVTNFLYWNDQTKKTIVRQPLALTLATSPDSIQTVYKNAVSNLTGIAADWYTGNVYFADGNSSTIGVTSGDLRQLVYIFFDDASSPIGIAVDPDFGLMFWIETGKGVVARLCRATMAGTSRKTLDVHSSLADPQAITTDLVAKTVYWVNGDSEVIGSCDYNGRNIRSFSGSMNGGYIGVAVYKDYVFATSQDNSQIDYYHKQAGTYMNNFYYDEQPIRVDVLDQVTLQHHQCSTLNCAQLCLNQGNGTGVCACVAGYTLQPDGHSCTPQGMNGGLIAFLVILCLVILALIILLACCCYRKKKLRAATAAFLSRTRVAMASLVSKSASGVAGGSGGTRADWYVQNTAMSGRTYGGAKIKGAGGGRPGSVDKGKGYEGGGTLHKGPKGFSPASHFVPAGHVYQEWDRTRDDVEIQP